MHDHFFHHASAARRYALARPFYHPLIAGRIQDRLGNALPVARAVDVGAGTGMSTRVLTSLAREVIGIDPSAAMIAEAAAIPNGRFILGSAEALPVPDGSVGLLTVSSALHWFDGTAFLAEARRVLEPGGWLVVYSHDFTGEMACVPAFTSWSRGTYTARFPTPPRNTRTVGDNDLAASLLRRKALDEFDNWWPFTARSLAAYLSTQSNVIDRVENGSESLESALEWIVESVTPFFVRPSETFRFRVRIDFLERVSPPRSGGAAPAAPAVT